MERWERVGDVDIQEDLRWLSDDGDIRVGGEVYSYISSVGSITTRTRASRTYGLDIPAASRGGRERRGALELQMHKAGPCDRHGIPDLWVDRWS